MKRITAAVALSLIMPLAALADGAISGTALNKADRSPLDFATVTLENARTGDYVAGTTTDSSGKYSLPTVPAGQYNLKISYIGFVTQERPVTVGRADVAMPAISLAEDSKVLKEVEVVGVKGQMRFELDRKVFNVDSNIAAAGVSASELLEAIPSVEVDQDGEVSLRGNSSVTVWINGKESGLTADNRAQILEQIPAETIQRVEVITNPSAKYSPEGTAGIINIVLKEDRRNGYFGSAELSANTRGGANANFNINFNTGRFESFAGLGLRMRHNHGGSKSERLYDDSDLYLSSRGDSRNHGDNVFLRLGTTYHATSADKVYFSGFGMLGHRWGHTTTIYNSNLPSQWNYNANRAGNSGDMRGGHIELGYMHKWSDSHTLDINAGFNHWGGPSLNTYLQEQQWPGAQPDDPDTYQSIYQEQSMDVKSNMWEVKADYTNQLTGWLKLEAGYNGNFNREDTPNITYSGTGIADITLDTQLYNRFIYDNDINALYFTLGGNAGKFNFSAGLRGEAWQIRTRSLSWGQTEAEVPLFRKNTFSLFPSAFISWSLPHDNELQINYTRRIRRPWGGQLNSFENISNPTNISYGNPELQPEYSNSFEINYIKTWTQHMISFSGYLRHSSDVMNRISYLDGDVLYSTWANAGSQVNSGCEIVIKNNFFRVLDLTTTTNLYNSHISAWSFDFERYGQYFPVSGKARNSFAWDIRCMASVRLPWQLSFQATGRYNSRRINAQGSQEPGWNVDAGLRKNVGNWSFSVNCRDIFDSRKRHSYTYGPGYSQEDERWRGGRQVRFTVKYSFGNMKAKRDRNNMDPDAGMGDGEMNPAGYSND